MSEPYKILFFYFYFLVCDIMKDNKPLQYSQIVPGRRHGKMNRRSRVLADHADAEQVVNLLTFAAML